MSTSYAVLCTLEATHEYDGGRTRDVTFVIPEQTARLLARGRLMAKTLDGLLHIVFEARGDGTPVLPMPGAVLRIGLQLNDASFANFTDLGFMPGPEVAVWSNAGDGQLGQPVIAIPAGRVLTRGLTRVDRPVDVKLTGAGGQVHAAVTVPAGETSSVSFDLEGLEPGLYTLVEGYPQDVEDETPCYVHPELVRESLLGVVEIDIAEGFYAAPAALTVPFTAKSETLRYYVVAHDDSAAEFEQLTVKHTPPNGDPEITFSRKLPEDFDESEIPATLLAAGGDASVALFHSLQPVKRRAGGYQNVKLSRKGDEIIGNLPQASRERASADHFVHLSKPKP
jgi:hypothetical protein